VPRADNFRNEIMASKTKIFTLATGTEDGPTWTFSGWQDEQRFGNFNPSETIVPKSQGKRTA
jgi:hypothetical protein